METEAEKKEEAVVSPLETKEIEVKTAEKKEVEVATEKKSKKWECKLGKICKGNKATVLAVLVLVLLVVGSFAFARYYKQNNVGPEVVKAKIEGLVKESGGTVKEVVVDGDLYKVTITISGQDQPVYVSKDGKRLIQGVITFDEIDKQKEAAKKQTEASNKPVPKAEKPQVDLYVMAFCPYGNKAEDTMKSVYDLLKTKVDFNFHYIVNVSGSDVQSLHGPTEVTQDEREACVLRDAGKDKWLAFATYVNDKCGSDGSCWEAGAKSLGLTAAKISACVAKDGLALMKANADASTKANATGSPTLVINGASSQAVYQYGKAEAYKQAICDSFNTAPAECAKVLADQAAASSAQGGSCN